MRITGGAWAKDARIPRPSGHRVADGWRGAGLSHVLGQFRAGQRAAGKADAKGGYDGHDVDREGDRLFASGREVFDGQAIGQANDLITVPGMGGFDIGMAFSFCTFRFHGGFSWLFQRSFPIRPCPQTMWVQPR